MCEIVAAPQVEVPGIMGDLIPQFAPDNEKIVDDCYIIVRTIVGTSACHVSLKPVTAFGR